MTISSSTHRGVPLSPYRPHHARSMSTSGVTSPLSPPSSFVGSPGHRRSRSVTKLRGAPLGHDPEKLKLTITHGFPYVPDVPMPPIPPAVTASTSGKPHKVEKRIKGRERALTLSEKSLKTVLSGSEASRKEALANAFQGTKSATKPANDPSVYGPPVPCSAYALKVTDVEEPNVTQGELLFRRLSFLNSSHLPSAPASASASPISPGGPRHIKDLNRLREAVVTLNQEFEAGAPSPNPKTLRRSQSSAKLKRKPVPSIDEEGVGLVVEEDIHRADKVESALDQAFASLKRFSESVDHAKTANTGTDDALASIGSLCATPMMQGFDLCIDDEEEEELTEDMMKTPTMFNLKTPVAHGHQRTQSDSVQEDQRRRWRRTTVCHAQSRSLGDADMREAMRSAQGDAQEISQHERDAMEELRLTPSTPLFAKGEVGEAFIHPPKTVKTFTGPLISPIADIFFTGDVWDDIARGNDNPPVPSTPNFSLPHGFATAASILSESTYESFISTSDWDSSSDAGSITTSDAGSMTSASSAASSNVSSKHGDTLRLPSFDFERSHFSVHKPLSPKHKAALDAIVESFKLPKDLRDDGRPFANRLRTSKSLHNLSTKSHRNLL